MAVRDGRVGAPILNLGRDHYRCHPFLAILMITMSLVIVPRAIASRFVGAESVVRRPHISG